MSLSINVLSPSENNINVHDLLTFQLITGLPKAKGATLFACDLQVSGRVADAEQLILHICYLIRLFS